MVRCNRDRRWRRYQIIMADLARTLELRLGWFSACAHEAVDIREVRIITEMCLR